MEARPSTHPAGDVLAAFGHGKLDDVAANAILAHLDGCEECRRRVAAQFGESFLQDFPLARAKGTLWPTRAPASPEPMPATVADPSVPSELRNHPQYEIVRELGRGGMGVVYLAFNKYMQQPEVLKVMNPALLSQPEAIDRFLREIRSAAALSRPQTHPNIVTIYTTLEIGSLFGFTMEYVDGEDLAKVVKRRGGPLPVANACYYIQQAALGLQHAFEKGMVHRDIKPHNLMLYRDEKRHIVKILDFGLAKATSEARDRTHLTSEGQMLGTPDFIAPEQILDAAKADIRADIYSLGCTLYYLLAGVPPFKERNVYAVLHAHQTTEARPLHLVRVDVPQALAAVVQKMMAKDSALRHQTPIEAVNALERFVKPNTLVTEVPSRAKLEKDSPVLVETVIEESVSTTDRAVIRKAQKRARDRKWRLVGGALIVLAFLALLISWLSEDRKIGRSQPKSPVLPLAQDGSDKQKAEVKQVAEAIRELAVNLGGGVKMEFVHIPRGKFMMGSPETEMERSTDEQLHEVQITRDFYLGKYPVTQEQYERLIGSDPSYFSKNGAGKDKVAGLDTARFPVETVLWEDAVRYCEKLTEKHGNGQRRFRLPTEAEWEYACRGGRQTAYYFGSSCNATQANCDGTRPYGTNDKGPYLGRTSEVGAYALKAPHPWGLCDMHGNVWQWCQDWYDKGYYRNSPKSDPECTKKDESRVLRGGSWFNEAWYCRAAERRWHAPSGCSNCFGFRVAFCLD